MLLQIEAMAKMVYVSHLTSSKLASAKFGGKKLDAFGRRVRMMFYQDEIIMHVLMDPRHTTSSEGAGYEGPTGVHVRAEV